MLTKNSLWHNHIQKQTILTLPLLARESLLKNFGGESLPPKINRLLRPARRGSLWTSIAVQAIIHSAIDCRDGSCELEAQVAQRRLSIANVLERVIFILFHISDLMRFAVVK